jgi:predicted unusual protein kinase regulating ubiquinone biosynthesis (AarF/ABC1/UbiB family)
MPVDDPLNGLKVPTGRLTRLARLGGMAAGMGGRVVLNGALQMASGQRPRMADLLFTPTNALKLTEELARMRGAAMKVGQLMSMDSGDFMPPEFAQVMARLRADAHHMPPQQLRDVLDRSWGKGWLRHFARFDVRPIASASIGQVHRAQTRDGRDLAIKVQYPGIRDSIDSDVTNVAGLLRLSGLLPRSLNLAPLLEQARSQLHEEADYAAEGRHMVAYAGHLAGNADFLVPQLHGDFSGQDVLAMDYLESQPIETLITASQAERDRVAGLLIGLALAELFQFNLMQTDPNFANYRYNAKTGQIVLLDFGATRAFAPNLAPEFRALLASRGREALRQAALEIGYVSADTAPDLQVALLGMMEISLAPLQSPEVFDFAASDLPQRVRNMGMMLSTRSDLPPVPPVDVLYLHRKLGGLFLLAHRLRARLPISTLMGPYL